MPTIPKSVLYLYKEELRFMSKVDRNGPTHPYITDLGLCHLWTGAVNSRWGYGNFSSRGKTYRAHVMAYILAYGEVPVGEWVLHSCDVKLCVNPEHLWLGNHDDNMEDMTAKLRQVYGTSKWSNFLTVEQVVEIRTRYRPGLGAKLAKEFGCSQQHVSEIVNYKKWKVLG